MHEENVTEEGDGKETDKVVNSLPTTKEKQSHSCSSSNNYIKRIENLCFGLPILSPLRYLV